MAIQISPAQEAALAASSFVAFERRCIAFLNEHFPEYPHLFGDDGPPTLGDLGEGVVPGDALPTTGPLGADAAHASIAERRKEPSPNLFRKRGRNRSR